MANFNGTELLNGSITAEKALKFQVGTNDTENDRITADLKGAGVTKISQFTMDTPASRVRAARATINEGSHPLNIEGKTLEFEIENGKDRKADITRVLEDVIKKTTSEGSIAGGDQSIMAGVVADLTAKSAANTYKLTIGGIKYSMDTKTEDIE